MKLNRHTLRKMILNEIKMLNEGFDKGELSANKDKLVFHDFVYQVKTSGFTLGVKKAEVKTDGSVFVAVKPPWIPGLSDGKVKSGIIKDDLAKLKSKLMSGQNFSFKMKDKDGKDLNLSFIAV